MTDRLDYDQKAEKTDGGELVSSYMCSPETAAEEFEISKRIYHQITGRTQSPEHDMSYSACMIPASACPPAPCWSVTSATQSYQGSHILLSFIWEPVILEGVSHHFGERVISIGAEHLFDSYEGNPPDCWEDISIPSDVLDYDCITLFLGESGKVYWLCYDGDSLGIAGNSILDFFASRFSLIDDCNAFRTRSLWTAEDIKIMRDFRIDTNENLKEQSGGDRY